MFHANRAIELDDRLELGHITLAQLLTLQGQEKDAREALARARALNHNDALIYNAQTFINLFQKTPDTAEMEEAGLEAIRLSPQDPMLWSFYWMLAVAIWMRDMTLGENMRKYLEPAARNPGAEAFVHSAYAVLSLRAGDRGTAQRALEQALTVRPDFSLEVIKYGFHFPKWPALVAGIKDDLETLVSMGLPRR
jgi:Flp pilus assembly protein TadD